MSIQPFRRKGSFADFPACIYDRLLVIAAAIRTVMAECRTQITYRAELFGRFDSQGDAGYDDRLLSAMRKQFGGHDEKQEESGTSQLRKVT
jgi:hypothetical protein